MLGDRQMNQYRASYSRHGPVLRALGQIDKAGVVVEGDEGERRPLFRRYKYLPHIALAHRLILAHPRTDELSLLDEDHRRSLFLSAAVSQFHFKSVFLHLYAAPGPLKT